MKQTVLPQEDKGQTFIQHNDGRQSCLSQWLRSVVGRQILVDTAMD